MTDSERREHSIQPAELTVVVFESLLPGDTTPGGDYILLLPSLRPLGRPAVIQLLADLPKPITCVGLNLDSTLVLGWWATDVAGASNSAGPSKGRLDFVFDSYRDLRSPLRSEPFFAFDSRGTILAVALSTLEQWFIEYRLALVSWAIDDPSAQLAADGFVGALRFARSRGSHLEVISESQVR